MEMRMGLHLEQKLNTEMRLEMRQTMKLQLLQTMRDFTSDLSTASENDTEAAVEQAYDKAVDLVDNPDLSPFLSGPESMRPLLTSMIKEQPGAILSRQFALATINEINDHQQRGEYQLPSGLTTNVKSHDLLSVYSKESTVKSEIQVIESEVRNNRDADHTGALQRLRELRTAMETMEGLRGLIDNLATFLEKVVMAPGKNQAPIRDALIDVQFLKAVGGAVSERVFNRATKGIIEYTNRAQLRGIVAGKPPARRSRGEKIGASDEKGIPVGLKHAVTNMVGELTLTSLGVIDKNLFVLMKGDVPVLDDDVAKKIQEDTGLAPEDLLNKHNLKSSGFYYFQRYQTLARRPSAKTDEEVRLFITNCVRADQEKLLEALGFEDELKTFADTWADGDNKAEDKGTDILEMLNTMLTKPAAVEFIKERIRTRYYPQLKSLLAQG